MSVEWDGMREFAAALASLTDDLKAEMAPVVKGAIQGMAADLEEQYPEDPEAEDPGALRRGVKTSMDSPLSGRVRATAPHTHLFEFGTVQRFTKRSGANRGVMPAANPAVFVPTAIKHREQMLEQAEAVLKKPRPAIGDGSMV